MSTRWLSDSLCACPHTMLVLSKREHRQLPTGKVRQPWQKGAQRSSGQTPGMHRTPRYIVRWFSPLLPFLW